ncbi:peptidase inhibitor family I36 protein [Actinomadura madurae]|uniref:Peptidase inhibitor family I36 n=1 Tax=Actinomadura madurae TaxID=1993 RepID=A0A1I4WRT6_9ACTN|nr:peptidase inhibitor family I36 protein [Actinomadura madurae]SFN15873.1 Peptidase inhibitor family I36 [Actinomadura madurae]SPT63006.1 Uncharacterised protein [Actinomadura madurae]
MKKITVAAMAAAGLATLLTPTTAQADAAWQGSCAKGDFCVWSDKNGTGIKCAWTGDDPDWYGGDIRCNPRFFVVSYWNNGYTGSYSKVKVYMQANYKRHWATIPAGKRESLWEGQPLRSHRWAN